MLKHNGLDGVKAQPLQTSSLHTGGAKAPSRQKDNIGVLRLILASLVIVGHAPEMVDGSRVREPMTVVFGTLSLGEVAVDAFFLISGYLITSSWSYTRSMARYLKKRLLRIYPAFVLSYCLCVALAYFLGGDPSQGLPNAVVRLVLLHSPPNYPGMLTGVHYATLNGSMWTIAYEFRCYLLVAVLGMTGLLARPRVVSGFVVAGLLAMVLATFEAVQQALDSAGHFHGIAYALGSPLDTVRLTTAFLLGSCAYLHREMVSLYVNRSRAWVCACAAALLLFHDPHFGEVSLLLFGGVFLFWIAFQADLGPVQVI